MFVLGSMLAIVVLMVKAELSTCPLWELVAASGEAVAIVRVQWNGEEAKQASIEYYFKTNLLYDSPP
jgi:hypothetical protein